MEKSDLIDRLEELEQEGAVGVIENDPNCVYFSYKPTSASQGFTISEDLDATIRMEKNMGFDDEMKEGLFVEVLFQGSRLTKVEDTHECSNCGMKAHIDSEPRSTYSWCDSCDMVTRHSNL